MGVLASHPFVYRYRYAILFVFFSIVGFIIYYPSLSVGFLSDDYSSINYFRENGMGNIFMGRGGQMFIPLTLFAIGILFKIFGLFPLGYHIFIIFLHILNALLLVWFAERLLKYFKVIDHNTFLPAFISGILFLVNPYQTESITWIICIGYPLCLAFTLGSMLVFLQWMQRSNIWLLILSGLLFFISILAKEVSLPLPAILLLILYAGNYKNKKLNNKSCLLRTFQVGLLYTTLIVVYFLYRHLMLGVYIGHYGSDVHLNFNFILLWQGLIAYAAKFFLLYRFLPVHTVLVFLKQHLFISLSLMVLLLAIIYLFRKPIKSMLYLPAFRLSLLFLVCTLLSLITVINLELSFLGEIQSDRYGYFASVFYSLSVVFLVVSIVGIRKRLWYLLLLPALWFAFLTYGENKKWEHSSTISENFYHSIREKIVDVQSLYLINVPDTYKGAYVLRNSINEGLKVKDICSNCTVKVLSGVSIRDDSGSIAYLKQGNTIFLKTDGSGIKFLPCEKWFSVPEFSFYYSSSGIEKITIKDTLPMGTVIYFVNPDGSVSNLDQIQDNKF